MFLSRNKKNNVYPSKPQFYYIKVGFNGVNIIQACFCDVMTHTLAVTVEVGVETYSAMAVLALSYPEIFSK